MRELFEEILNEILAEEENSKEFDIEANDSIYTPEQEKFLGHFGKTKNQSLGIIYSLSPAGFQEFLNRSGAMYNLTADVLVQLLKAKIISIVPYIGYSRNTDYTIKCNVPTEDLADFSTDGETNGNDEVDASGMSPSMDSSGGAGGFSGGIAGSENPIGADVPEDGADVPDEAPEESFRKDGTLIVETNDYVHMQYTYPQILQETVKIAKKLITEQRGNESFAGRVAKSRVLNRLPAGYLTLLEKIIKNLSSQVHNTLDKEHLVADILDNLSHNFGLTPNQILKSYTFYQNQNRLKNLVKK